MDTTQTQRSIAIHSGSEPFDESEEVRMAKRNQRKAERYMKEERFSKALQYINEALEIDAKNIETLKLRAQVQVKLKDYKDAVKNVDWVCSLEPDRYENEIFRTAILNECGQTQEAILCILKTLHFPKCHTEEVVEQLLRLVGKALDINLESMSFIKDRSVYETLCELGVLANDKQAYRLCTELISTAQSYQTNTQLGLRMRSMLTLANAHSALNNRRMAITAYNDCLNAAVSTKDLQYQIKSLASMATLHLRSGDTQSAILYYERLLNLKLDLTEETLSECWPGDLDVALYVNLSAAYRSIGDYHKALRYAETLLEFFNDREEGDSDLEKKTDTALSIGELCAKLGQIKKMLQYYELYLEGCKKLGDRPKKAHAYGKIGRVYAYLANHQLSESCHSQFVATAQQYKDDRLLFEAYEALGDSMMILEYFSDALTAYNLMNKLAEGFDIRSKINGLYKLGNAYKALDQKQSALYHYQNAEMYAEEADHRDLLLLIQIKMADIMQSSSQLLELETGRQYLEKIIPTMEEYICAHREESTYCDPELYRQLDRAYRGLQMILVKSAGKLESVEVTDNCRKWTWYRFMARRSVDKAPSMSESMTSFMSSQLARFWEARSWTREHILAALDKQSSTVLYYSLIEENIILWVLQPGQGVVRQYQSKNREKITPLVDQLFKYDSTTTEMDYFGENRVLPLKDSDIKRTIWRRKRKDGVTPGGKTKPTAEDMRFYLRLLYENLLTPVQDILDELTRENPSGADLPRVTVIPDRELYRCPFHALTNKRSEVFGNKFSVTQVSSILLLDRITSNELDHLKIVQDTEAERLQLKTGMRDATSVNRNSSGVDEELIEQHKGNKVSNPYLLYRPVQSKRLEKDGKVEPLHNVSTVTTETCTGTMIARSSVNAMPFRQIADAELFLAIGSPHLPESLEFYGQLWKPSIKLVKARAELLRIEEVCEARVIAGKDATKDAFLEHAPRATIIHLATWGCQQEGLLAFSPNPSRQQPGAPDEGSYLLTPNDLFSLKLNARLVVLSSAWATQERPPPSHEDQGPPLLSSLLLLAGAECVLTVLWPVPMEVLNLFYFTFYGGLREGGFISTAYRSAVKAVRETESYNEFTFWAPFVLYGKDVYLDVNFVRHAHLDQTVDTAEKVFVARGNRDPLNPVVVDTAEKVFVARGNRDPLNPVVVDTKAHDLDTKKNELQTLVSQLLKENKLEECCLPDLSQLLERSLKAWQNVAHLQTPPHGLIDRLGKTGRDFLASLGFEFLSRGPYGENPFIVYPTRTVLVACALDATRAMNEIIKHAKLTEVVFNYIPATQDSLSFMIDLLAITKHAGDLQLKVSDLSVRVLWQDKKTRAVLSSCGFTQVGILVHFAKTPENRRLLDTCLQLFLALSTTKSSALFYRLNVALLGSQPIQDPLVTSQPIGSQLPTLSPRANAVAGQPQLARSTPWMTKAELPMEMQEKMCLVDRQRLTEAEEEGELELEKHWQRQQLDVHANAAVREYYYAAQLGPKVKVHGSGGPSTDRVPLAQKPVLSVVDTGRKRLTARRSLQASIDSVQKLYQEKARRLYLPYIPPTKK